MTLETIRTPYELLVRWEDGKLKGAHIQWLYTTKDENDQVVASQVGQAEPVAVGKTQGFPLADILSKVQSDALAKIEQLEQENAQLKQQLEG